MQSLPSELLFPIALSFDSKTVVCFSRVNRSFRALVHSKAFVKQWFLRHPFPFAMKVVAKEMLFARGVDPAATFRFVYNLVVAINTVGRTVARASPLPERRLSAEEDLRSLFSAPSTPTGWLHLLWAACLTNDWRLARTIFHGSGIFTMREGGEVYEVYYDLLFRHGRWAEACEDIYHPLEACRWHLARVPKEWQGILFKGEKGPDLPDKGRFRCYPCVEGATKWCFLTSPAFSAKQVAEGLGAREISKVVIALCARGVTLDEFQKREIVDPEIEQGIRHWMRTSTKTHGLAAHTPTHARAIFMREGLGDDDLSPLFAILERNPQT